MAATPAICAKDMRIFACQLCGASIDMTGLLEMGVRGISVRGTSVRIIHLTPFCTGDPWRLLAVPARLFAVVARSATCSPCGSTALLDASHISAYPHPYDRYFQLVT